MKRDKQFFKEEITKEMEDWFNERTQRHINLVKEWGIKIVFEKILVPYIDIPLFIEDLDNHDKSKFIEPEYTPYIYVSWEYRCKDLGILYTLPEDIKTQMNIATNRHVTSNKHHPEYWMKNKILDVINRSDRDEPTDTLINCTSMPLTYIASMCADWMAMSEEKGNSPQEWAKKNVNIRWGFTKEQEDFIYLILNTIWK